AHPVRERRALHAAIARDAGPDSGSVAEPGRPRTGAAVARRPRMLGTREGRAVATALVSTVVVFTAIAVIVVNSAGWPALQRSFLNGHIFRTSFPDVARAFELNVRIFLIAEVLILALALGIAILRSLPGP